ncbi:MAG: 50S ribosomal protein L25 [Firmicutes bacterium]|nr:50S ribosomal protein L25 [Bacillota bacterium]
MASYQLKVERREETGKSQVRKLRWDNMIPGIVYGSGGPALMVKADNREIEKALAASGSLINLSLGDETKTVIVKEVQRDPVRGDILHVDFHAIALDKKLEISVPVRAIGEENRPNDGGVVSTLLWEITVSCLPTDIPEAIVVDVSNLELDGVITVAELDIPEGVEVIEDPDEAVVKVDIPELIIETEEDEDAEDAEDVDAEDVDIEDADEDDAESEEE